MRLLDPGQPPLPSLAERAELGGVEIATDTPLEAITPHLPDLHLLAIRFPVFRDGRGFSLAATLRGRGYRGELRATGHVLPDQASMLARSGFDAVERPPRDAPEVWAQAIEAFSASYQPVADGVPHVWALRAGRRAAAHARALEEQARALNAELRGAPAETVLSVVLAREFPGKVAVLSSFGAEAAVSLHLVAQLDPSTPVLFLETDRHFAQTLQYRDELTARLGLADVRTIEPVEAAAADPGGDLWRSDPNRCCAVRKVQPLANAASGFAALVTGRKRMQGGERVRLPVFEVANGQIKVNPLANWTTAEVDAYYRRHDLPRHPLVAQGFPSIGCWPCTSPSDSLDTRAGRWPGSDKTECGIHLPRRRVADPLWEKAS